MTIKVGAWFWAEDGTPTLDTTTSLIQEIVVPLQIVSTDTALHGVDLPPIDGTTTIVPQDNSNALLGDNGGEQVTVRVEGGQLRYQFFSTGKAAEMRALAF